MASGRSQVVLEFIGDDSRLQKTLGQLEKNLGGVTGMIGKLGKVGAGAFAFTSMANTAATLGSALVTLAPAALALPGIFMGVQVASQTLKMGLTGVADAIGGDAEAMAKLAPAAQQSVKAIQLLKTGFEGVQKAVQQKLFEGLAPELAKTGAQLLAIGQQHLPKVAAGFNGMALAALAAARNPFFQDDLRSIIDDTAGGLDNMRQVVGNVLRAFVGLGTIGAQYLPEIGAWIDRIAASFNGWVQNGLENGSIQAMVDGALEGFRQLGQLINAVISTVATFGRGLAAGLGTAATPLEMLTAHVETFAAALAAPEGQEALRRIGEMIASLSGAFSAVLPPLLSIVTTIASALAPAISGVADVVADNGGLFAGLIAGGFVAAGAVDVVTGAVETATGVIETVTAIQSAWNTVMEVWGLRAGIVRAATLAWTGVQWLLNAALSANPIGIVVVAIAALVAGLIWAYNNVGWFKDAVDAAFSFIVGIVTTCVDGIVAAWNDLVSFFSGGPSAIGDFLSGIGEWFASLPGIIGSALATAGQAVLDWFANLPMQIAFFLGYLAGTIYVGALAAWDFLWNTLPGILLNVAAWFANLPIQVGTWLLGLGVAVLDGAVAAWNWLVTTFNQANAQLMAWLAALPGQVGGFLAGLVPVVLNAASQAWTSFKNTTISVGTSALTWIQALPGKIMGFFAAAPSWLFNAGKQILEGLWNGLKSIAQGVLNWIADIGRQIAAGFAAAVGIHSPSKVFMEHGVNIGAGLIKGLENITPAVFAASNQMANATLAAAFARDLAAARASGATIFEDNSWRGMDRRYTDDIRMGPRGGSAPSGGGVQVTFAGNTSDALATVIMGMIRTGKIQIKAA